MKIMLDPGHAGDFFNKSPAVPEYYESVMAWKLALKLKAALEDRGFEAGLTRNKYEDPELTSRGLRAKGYDLFLSLHSNASENSAVDAPWLIHFSADGGMDLDEVSEAAAHVLGPVISRVMGVGEPYYYTKPAGFDRDGNGVLDDEWYGVLHGAKTAGVPGVIIEHSFHTNARAAEWLLCEENLQVLAETEADALAEYYGLEVGMTKSEKAEFDKLREQVETLSKRYGTVDDCPAWARETVQKLTDTGVLRGRNGGRLDLSDDAVRTLVILDRAGAFE